MREVVDGAGHAWRVDIVSHGRTSGYLNPKVHRPVLQFACVTRRKSRRYAVLPAEHGDTLDQVDDSELLRLLGESKPH